MKTDEEFDQIINENPDRPELRIGGADDAGRRVS